MSASFGQDGGSGSQDFDLNLAPIIDCLTVLIAFMLASASFLSIGILDAGVAAAGATATDNATPPPVNIAIELGSDHNFTVKVSGKATSSTPIAKKGSEWNYDELVQNLKHLKAQWPTVNAVTLSAENTVEYQNVVKSMEVIRQEMPVVLLGGF
jgi:biopolymer transport protein ExbD